LDSVQLDQSGIYSEQLYPSPGLNRSHGDDPPES
jgi:hypothetical protein